MSKTVQTSISAIRRDIQDYLVHFTRGIDKGSPFDVLLKILEEARIVGSSNFIKGGRRCICFSEAPLIEHISSFNISAINDEVQTRYTPFGLLFKKEFIFQNGGRPAIYQPDSDYNLLHGDLKYRHVTFEVGGVDFTWEREWRMQSDELKFDFSDIHVLVPSNDYAEDLFSEFSTTEAEMGVGFDGDEPVVDYAGHSAHYNLKVICLDVLGLKASW